MSSTASWHHTYGLLCLGYLPTVGMLDCVSHMTEVKVQISGEEYTILKCDNNFKLSIHVSTELPDFVLIRQCTLDMISLVRDNIATVGRFLITGTPGVGKTVSVIAWLYLAWKGELNMPFKYIIADLKAGCILLSKTEAGSWIERLYDRNIFNTERFEATQVLYIYDATFKKLPLILPYCSVVFSSPDLHHFKEFINIDIVLRKIYFTPIWQWDEVEALYSVSNALQSRAPLDDIKRLFQVWGGLPRQIFLPYELGYQALCDAINSCDAIACIQALEKGSFLSYGEEDSEEVRSRLMHIEVMDVGIYEHAIVNFGSSFIRDGLVEASGKASRPEFT